MEQWQSKKNVIGCSKKYCPTLAELTNRPLGVSGRYYPLADVNSFFGNNGTK